MVAGFNYTSALKNVIMEQEMISSGKSLSDGLTYRYTYGVKIQSVVYGDSDLADGTKLYYHLDRLGSTRFMTNNTNGKVAAYVDYDAWGYMDKKAVIKGPDGEIDVVMSCTGHPYDQVLGLYFAQARLYDQNDRRFVAVDAVGGWIFTPNSQNPYLLCRNNPVKYIDKNGLFLSGTYLEIGAKGDDVFTLIKALHQLWLDGKLETWIHNVERDTGVFGETTLEALKEYINKCEGG